VSNSEFSKEIGYQPTPVPEVGNVYGGESMAMPHIGRSPEAEYPIAKMPEGMTYEEAKDIIDEEADAWAGPSGAFGPHNRSIGGRIRHIAGRLEGPIGRKARAMSYQQISELVGLEVRLQDLMRGQEVEVQFPPDPEEIYTAEEHDKIYVPRLPDEQFRHTIIVERPEELAHVFDAAARTGGGYYPHKDGTIRHEMQHADAARRLGQKHVRFIARLVVGEFQKTPNGGRGRHIGIEAGTLLEDVSVSRLDLGLFLAFPEDTVASPGDTAKIKYLGYENADDVIRRAAAYNAQTRSNRYPLPPGF
jgi:hypothetical protein